MLNHMRDDNEGMYRGGRRVDVRYQPQLAQAVVESNTPHPFG